MADRYFVNGGVNSNWSSASNWAATSGGVGGSTVPSNTDNVLFDANSPNCVVDGIARVALSLNFTGYTNTITMTFGITVSGNITLAASMNILGTGGLVVAFATPTITSNGKAWPNAFSTSGNQTLTLADDWHVGGLLSLPPSNSSIVVNGNTFYASGGLSCNSTTGSLTGTTAIVLDGTGTVTLATGSSVVRYSGGITINTAGTITFAAAVHNLGCPLTYVAGTVVTTGSTLTMQSSVAAVTLASHGIIWNNVSIGAGVTHTLINDLTLTGLLTLVPTAVDTVINGSSINCYGGVTFASTTGSCQGTTILKILGTQTLAAPSVTTGRVIDMPLVLNAGAGTITINDKFRCNGGKLTYVSGTVISVLGNTWETGSGSAETSYASIL